MSVHVSIPAGLRGITQGANRAEIEARTVAEILEALETRYPGTREKILNPDGSIRTLVNVFVNSEDVRFAQGLATPVADGDQLAIVMAMAGG